SALYLWSLWPVVERGHRSEPMRRRLLVLGLAAVAVGLAIVVASLQLGTERADTTSARVAPTPHGILTQALTLGAQADWLAVAPISELLRRMGLVRQPGARITRVDALWNEVAPTRPRNPADPNAPAYRWQRYDVIANGLARRGIAPIFSVYRSPSWAN